jgi:hypothetical protein
MDATGPIIRSADDAKTRNYATASKYDSRRCGGLRTMTARPKRRGVGYGPIASIV